MNIYQLFTEKNSYFVAATMSYRAIVIIEQVTGERVTSWIIAASTPSSAVILNA